MTIDIGDQQIQVCPEEAAIIKQEMENDDIPNEIPCFDAKQEDCEHCGKCIENYEDISASEDF